MYLSLFICDDNLYQEAKGFFIQQGRSDLLVKEGTSLIGAYVVTQHLRQNGKPGFNFIDGVYTYEDMFFSVSHSEDFLMVAVDNKKIAVDIEHIHTRDASLLRNVKIQNSPYSKRENFYIQRTAKECLVKFLNLTSNEMKDMKVSKFEPHSHFSVDDWEFSSLIKLRYLGNEYSIHVDIKNGRVMSLLQDDTQGANNQNINQNYIPPVPDNGQYLCSMERTGMFKPIDF